MPELAGVRELGVWGRTRGHSGGQRPRRGASGRHWAREQEADPIHILYTVFRQVLSLLLETTLQGPRVGGGGKAGVGSGAPA